MSLMESLLLVNAMLSIIAVAVSVYLIPHMRTGLVNGWKLMVVALAIFSGMQLLRLAGSFENTQTVLNTLFAATFLVGLFVHFTTLVKHVAREKARK